MKHYSAAAIEQAALRTEAELVERLRSDLAALSLPGPFRPTGAGPDAAKRALAYRLGVAEARLTAVLRGRGLSDRVAAGLGYRRVTRFERLPHEVVLRGDPKRISCRTGPSTPTVPVR